MARWRSIIQVLALTTALCASGVAAASEYHGVITFGGLPLPGATITLSQGTQNLTTISDQNGTYRFENLPDGSWKVEVTMLCFSPIAAEVSVGPTTSAGAFELKLLPSDQLLAMANPAKAPPRVEPTLKAPEERKAQTSAEAKQPVDIPKPPTDQNPDSADGFLVNGSVNNAATSQFSLDRAFGNRRPNSRNLYNGMLALNFDNSALNARAYSLTGLEIPKPTYNAFTGVVAIGGPLKIPRLLPRGPTFFADYQWTRNQNEQDETGLVPTVAERAGDLAGLTNVLGQPITVFNPTTGIAFPNNQVPVSAQASALLQLYPVPNIVANPLYNYQAPVLDDTHQDVVQSKLEKSIGHREQLFGGFNLQNNRASNVNLFKFVDATDTLGFNTNINWQHRFSQHLFVTTRYDFSRLRTRITSEFENRENISGAAGIIGNDQDPADWGPPALNFSSGIVGLTDANTSFDRNRTDRVSGSVGIYRHRHNITLGGEFRRQEYNDFYQQNPRGGFTFTGAATSGASTSTTSGSDLADFLIGIPDTSAIAFGNADKYFRQSASALYAQDDWRLLPSLTIIAGGRWEYGAPITELKNRLVNLDITPGFGDSAPVLASDSTGALTGIKYPNSLIRPDKLGFEPRVGISWRPIPASTVVVRASYGVYHDTSVYLGSAQQLAQQAPLSTSLNVENSAACPLTLADGFTPCSSLSADTYAVDPNFRVGYAQTWRLSVQRDLPAAMQVTATYLGIKGTRGVQEFLPNTYPPGAVNPCPACPLGFEYRSSGGDSTRQSGELQLRRRLRGGFMASLDYLYSKSIDDDALLGGQGHVEAGSPSEASAQSAAPTAQSVAIAQNWLNLHAERSLSTFDQRHSLSVQAQYTSGQGLEGGTLMGGWPGRLLKEWTVLTRMTAGTGMPETPVYMAAVPGTGFTGTIRPDLTGIPLALSGGRVHPNAAAYAAPPAGMWGNAGRDSITGPGQLTLDSSLERTFRATGKYNVTARLDATNVLNHAVFAGWVTTINSTQFGLPASVNSMRSLETTVRVRF